MLADLPDGVATRELVAAIWLHDIVYDPRDIKRCWLPSPSWRLVPRISAATCST